MLLEMDVLLLRALKWNIEAHLKNLPCRYCLLIFLTNKVQLRDYLATQPNPIFLVYKAVPSENWRLAPLLKGKIAAYSEQEFTTLDLRQHIEYKLDYLSHKSETVL